jgi:hypothetical protein
VTKVLTSQSIPAMFLLRPDPLIKALEYLEPEYMQINANINYFGKRQVFTSLDYLKDKSSQKDKSSHKTGRRPHLFF